MRAQVSERPNWLLWGLVIISLAVHAMILADMAGLFHPRKTEYIELEMHSEQRPIGRIIPVPPRHPRQVRALKVPGAKSIRPMSVQNVIAKPVMPKVAPTPSAVTEPIGVPERPEVEVPRIFSYSPLPTQDSVVPAPNTGVTSYGSAENYLSMVRMRIERHKKYPIIARKRHMEGRVRLRFIIGPDGRVRSMKVVGKSRYSVLDKAAVRAVMDSAPFPEPPKDLFAGPVPLEVSIVFELM